MIERRHFRSTTAVELTFVLPDDADAAVLVTSALDWRPLPMRRRPDGTGPLRAKLRVPGGPDVEFRYLVDGDRWTNDPDADDERPNGLGGTNSVVRTTPPAR